MPAELRFVEEPPTPEAYAELRDLVGWRNLAPDCCAVGLGNSLYSVSVYEGDDLVGCGRVIGDGGIYFYIQDMIVYPRLRGRSIGGAIMERIMDFLAAHAKPRAPSNSMCAGASGAVPTIGPACLSSGPPPRKPSPFPSIAFGGRVIRPRPIGLCHESCR